MRPVHGRHLSIMPAHDDEILAEFTWVAKGNAEVEVQVLVITWP
jgi:hypothetical protein